MRYARMPGVYYDKEKKRYFCQMKVPKDLQAAHGTKPFKHTFPQTVSREVAEVQSVGIRAGWIVQVDDWRRETQPDLPPTPYRELQRYNPMTRKTDTLFVLAPEPPEGFDASPVVARPMIDVTPSAATLDQAIADCKLKHGPFRDDAAEKKYEAAKRRPAMSLFEVAKTTDMAAITTATVQRWVDGLSDPRQAYDFVSEIKNLYGRLDAKNRLPGGNPCAKIETPPKPDHNPRDEFSPERAKLIVASALRQTDPLIKWGPIIMAMTGMIITEFLYAPTSEIKQMDGVWVWHVGEKRKLKTGNRPRVIPLHDALIRAGFLDYVRSRGDGRLFDGTNTAASERLMAHLRDADGLNIQGDDQVNYSWRHTFISALVAAGTDPTLRRYLDGHGLGHIDEKHYIHHHMPQMVAAINALHDPTAPPTAQAAE
jgi:integrase